MPSPETETTESSQGMDPSNQLKLAGIRFHAEATASPVDGMSTVMRMQQLALASIGIEFPPEEKK